MSVAPLAKHRPTVVPLSPNVRKVARTEDTEQEHNVHTPFPVVPLRATPLLEAEKGGDTAAVARALRALPLTEHDPALLPFLVHLVAALVERPAQRATSGGNLIDEILDLLAGTNGAFLRHGSQALREPLTEAEMRVLRYLPTDLSKQEIANELYVSVNTVKSHVKHLYAKLDARTRRQAITRARELGLLKHSLRSA